MVTLNHELRTPLTSVVGYTELLLAGEAGELNEDQLRMLHRVTVSSRHLLGLVETLLRVSHECLVENRETDVAALVIEMAEDARLLSRTRLD